MATKKVPEESAEDTLGDSEISEIIIVGVSEENDVESAVVVEKSSVTELATPDAVGKKLRDFVNFEENASTSRGNTLALTAEARRKDATITDMLVYQAGKRTTQLVVERMRGGEMYAL